MQAADARRLTLGHGRDLGGWWVVIAGVLFAMTVGGTVFYGLGAFFAPIQSEFGWSFTTLSLAFSVQALVMGASSFVIGWLIDRVAARLLAVVGVALVAIGFFALGSVTSPQALYVVFGLMGLGATPTTFLLFNALVAQWFPNRMGTALAVVQVGYGVGGLIAPAFVFLILDFGWRAAATLAAVAVVVVCGPLCLVLKSPPVTRQHLSGGEPPSGTAIEELLTSTENALAQLGTREALATAAFWILLLVLVVSSSVSQVVYTHQIRALIAFGVLPAIAGAVVGFAPVIGLAGRFGFGWLGERWGGRYPLSLALGLQALGVATLAVVHGNADPTLYLFGVIYGVGQGGIFLLSPMIQREYFGTRSFGTIQGLLLGPSSLISALAPLMIGAYVDQYASYRPVFWICVILVSAVMTILVVWGAGPSRRAAKGS